MGNPIKKSRGAALLTALIVVFIVMAIIANIAVRNYRVIRGLTNQKIKEQAYYILMSAVALGRAGLATSGAATQVDSLQGIWAQPLPKTNIVDDFQMSGYITDEQSKFNINDLVSNGNVNTVVLQQFSNLLSYLNIPSSISYNIAYYMASPQNQSDIMMQYTTSKPAYAPAGRPLVDLSELFLVKGVESGWVNKMSKYVTAIPVPLGYLTESNESAAGFQVASAASGAVGGGMLVNVNTAPAEVIAAKSGIPLPVAQRMVSLRTATPFNTTQDITSFLSSNGIMMSQSGTQGTNNINVSALSTQSSYFTVHAVADKGDYEFKWVALLYRPNRGGTWPQVLWQHPE